MAEEGNDVLTDLDGGAAPNGADTRPTAGVVTQYVKDLSVENPNAPASFQWQEQPSIDVQFNIAAEKVGDEMHEVVLKTGITSKAGDQTAFIVELEYAGLIGLRNMDAENEHAFLYAEAPRLLFPFARRVIADAVRDAGFPPLMLEPIDFNGLYMQQLAARREEGVDPLAPNEGDQPAGGEG